jgi:hypothetical protein
VKKREEKELFLAITPTKTKADLAEFELRSKNYRRINKLAVFAKKSKCFLVLLSFYFKFTLSFHLK